MQAEAGRVSSIISIWVRGFKPRRLRHFYPAGGLSRLNPLPPTGG
nr:MAG TPA: hypothetical protein [Caudoviricetes sp.]